MTVIGDLDALHERLTAVESILGIDDVLAPVRAMGDAFAGSVRSTIGQPRQFPPASTYDVDDTPSGVRPPLADALEFAPCDSSGDPLEGWGWRSLTFDVDGKAHAFLPAGQGAPPAGLAIRVAR